MCWSSSVSIGTCMVFSVWRDCNRLLTHIRCDYELLEICRLVVPKDDWKRFRVLKILDALISRLGFKNSTEINNEVIDKIFEYVLEVRSLK